MIFVRAMAHLCVPVCCACPPPPPIRGEGGAWARGHADEVRTVLRSVLHHCLADSIAYHRHV